MSKILFKFFPLIDHLYIYQLFEYNSIDFLKWFLKNPFKRNLQRKHEISWTSKAKLIFIISFVLILIPSFWLTLFFIPLVSFFSPFFLVLSKFLIFPLEYYQKQKILNQTKQKLLKLPGLKIAAITGSYGKTSTKDILYTLLWKKFKVVKTPKSFNTSLGVAQTILEDVKDNTEILIAEIGAYKKSEIKKIVDLIKPGIGIITAVGPQHLGKFKSIENTANAKFEIVEGLSSDGLAILNGESDYLVNLSTKSPCKVLLFGKEKTGGYPFFASDTQVSSVGTSFLLHTPKGKIQIEIPLIGEHHVQNFLAASIAALNLGLTLKEIQERAKLLLPTPHRLEIKKQGNLTIIDNSYNTNPKAALESFKLLKDFPGSQKILITPGLTELGKDTETQNLEFAKNASKVADEIIIVGESFKDYLLKGLKEANYPADNVHTVTELKDGLNLLSKIAKPGAVILLENDLPDQYF